MPRINIYEHSDTYSFQVKNLAYACVAFPITAIWGPSYDSADEDLNPDWVRFQAGYRGTTDFVNTFRGPNTYMGARDKSYDYALKLLSAGYDILVKRADGLGSPASRNLIFNQGTASVAASSDVTYAGSETQPEVVLKATSKLLGTLGNRLKVWVDLLNEVSSDDLTKATEEETTTWSIKNSPTQMLKISVYLAGLNQTNLECLTVQPNDVLLESFNVTIKYDTAHATADKPVIIALGSEYGSAYVDTVTAWIPKNRTERSTWVWTLGVAATGTDPVITQGNEWSETLVTAGAGDAGFGQITLPAKYAGSFGNQLKVRVKVGSDSYGRKIGTIEVFDRNGYTESPEEVIRTDQLLEMQSVAFDINSATDAQPYVTEAIFAYLGTVTLQNENLLQNGVYVTSLLGGTDYATPGNGISTVPALDVQIMNMVSKRFPGSNVPFVQYIRDLIGNSTVTPPTAGSATVDQQVQLWNQQKVFENATAMLGELTDPLVYDWDAVFMGIADDQYIPTSWQEKHPEFTASYEPTNVHLKMAQVAAASKCGAAIIGTPFGMKRGTKSDNYTSGAVKFKDDLSALLGKTLSTFAELVGPWCKTTLPINGANSWITPELAHLLLIINAQGVGGQNKWWMVPAGMLGTGVVHSPEYRIKKAYMDIIQDHDEGVCMNPLMQVPGKGFTCFGNSTLWDKPLGTYNALQNLSTRFLTNRVKQRIWDTALQILFRYNNENAYSHFYAGVSPLLDEMRAVGALTGTDANPWGYRIIMNPDIVNLDRINANTVIGKVELAVTGVIDTVDVDLFLLPPTAFQSEV